MPRLYNRSLPPEVPGKRLLKKKEAPEFSYWAVTQLAKRETQLLQEEIPLPQPDCLLQSLRAVRTPMPLA